MQRARPRGARPRRGSRTAGTTRAWAAAETLELAHFRPEGSDHRPRTRARLLHTGDGLCGIFRVEDRYVRSRAHALRRSRLRGQLRRDLPPAAAGPRLPELRDELPAARSSRATSPITGACPAASRPFTRLRSEEGRRVRAALLAAARASSRRSTETARLAARLLHPARRSLERFVGPLGPLAGQAWRGQPLQVRRQDLAPALGLLVPARRRATSTCPAASARSSSR